MSENVNNIEIRTHTNHFSQNIFFLIHFYPHILLTKINIQFQFSQTIYLKSDHQLNLEQKKKNGCNCWIRTINSRNVMIDHFRFAIAFPYRSFESILFLFFSHLTNTKRTNCLSHTFTQSLALSHSQFVFDCMAHVNLPKNRVEFFFLIFIIIEFVCRCRCVFVSQMHCRPNFLDCLHNIVIPFDNRLSGPANDS